MKTCKTCERIIKDNYTHCFVCARKTRTNICVRLGCVARISDNYNYCFKCYGMCDVCIAP